MQGHIRCVSELVNDHCIARYDAVTVDLCLQVGPSVTPHTPNFRFFLYQFPFSLQSQTEEPLAMFYLSSTAVLLPIFLREGREFLSPLFQPLDD